MNYRIEKDTMGEIKVPTEKYWGAQTQRSIINFPIGPPASMPIEVIRAFGFLKKAAAHTNFALKKLSAEKKDLISTVCDEIINGELDDQFPLVIWQTGSGTQSNMNVNEVIANRAHVLKGNKLGEGALILHPNDDVNMSQSSNDTFPTAMHIAAYKMVLENTAPGIEKLCNALVRKAEEFSEIVKIGRTHWMDATPLTLGQELSGYISQLKHGLKALKNTYEHLSELALGGTAVGTGLNSPQGYDHHVTHYIAHFNAPNFTSAATTSAAPPSPAPSLPPPAALPPLAVSLMKIANDIRLMASGPRAGLGELVLPANEPGSSIMPGKVNPTQVEAITMVCVQVMGNDLAVSLGSASGHFELNVFKPMIIYNFLQSARLLSDACNTFADKCVAGIRINSTQINKHLENSLMLVTALTPRIGYEKAAKIAKTAHENNTTLKEEAVKSGFLTEAEFDQLVIPAKMTGQLD